MYVATFEELGGDARPAGSTGTRRGAPVSLLVLDDGEGGGPDLHKHTYHEVFVSLEGEAEIRG